MSQASGKVALVEKKIVKPDMPSFGAGDTVRVHVKIKEGDKERVQAYEGVVIGLQGQGSRKSFVVRKISHGVGVERVFPMYSPAVSKVEVLDEGRVRRSKIYYVRERSGKAARIRSESETQ
jgi:large subunit ribosomal protein L19